MDFRARRFQTSTLVAAAGCKSVTFRSWRHKHNLFPETKDSTGWNYFSIVDICVVRAVVVMTEHGLPVADAIWQADKWFRLYFLNILKGGDMTPLHGFRRGELAESDELKIFVDEDTGEVSDKPPPHWSKKTSASFIVIDGEKSVAELAAMSGGLITIIDLRTIIDHVLKEFEVLQPEGVATREETLRIVAETLANAIRPKPETEGGEE